MLGITAMKSDEENVREISLHYMNTGGISFAIEDGLETYQDCRAQALNEAVHTLVWAVIIISYSIVRGMESDVLYLS